MIVSQHIVPVLRINNRRVNQLFFEQTLGLKTRLEEGAFVELSGRQESTTCFILLESPSMRTRSVRGAKKLGRIVLKVENPLEIEQLLAKGSQFSTLYQGKRGYGFEAISPEGDVFLLHAEESLEDLQILSDIPSFSRSSETVDGISRVAIEQILIQTPTPHRSQQFYQELVGNLPALVFQEMQGEDLQVDADQTWDLESLHFFLLENAELSVVEKQLTVPYFKDKKSRFLQTTDPSHIEVWFEK